MSRSLASRNFVDQKTRAIIAFDRRTQPRYRVLKEARIILNHGQSTMSCLVRDISQDGARLQAPFNPDLPETFEMLINQDDTLLKARRVWFSGNQMGIRFLGRARPAIALALKK